MTAVLSSDRSASTPAWRSRSGLVDAAVAFVSARVLLLLGYAAAQAVASNLPGGVSLPFYERGLFAWDGDHYLRIAQEGYGYDPGALRFFPLYPLLGRVLSFPLFGWAEGALVLLSNAFALAAALLLRELVMQEWGDEKLARRSVWLLALFPSAFVFSFAYVESLMLTLSIGFFLCLRRGRWWWAAGLGLLAGLSRPTAVLLVLPALIEAWREVRETDLAGRVARLAAIASPVAGLCGYLAWVGIAYDDPWIPVDAQSDLRAGLQDPFSRIFEAARHVLTDTQADGPNLAFAVVFIALAAVCIRRLPASFSAYAVLTLVVALSAQNINSLGRYGLVAFPLVLALAKLCDEPRRYEATLLVCAGGTVALSTMTWLGGYIP